MKTTFDPIVFPDAEPEFRRTEWSRPPSSMKSRLGRREKQREESYQNRFLINLRKAFDDADTDEVGYLTQEQWDKSDLNAFLLDGTLSKTEFSLFFKRIDATSEGKVSWNKLVQYLLKVNTGTDSKKNHEAIQFIRKWPSPLTNHHHMHREMVEQILCSYKTNEYITISPDSIRFWNAEDLSYKRMINDTSLYCCGLVFESVSALAVATTNRKLFFYNIETLQRLSIEVCASPSAKMIKYMSQEQSLDVLKKLKHSEVPMFNVPTTLCIAENSILDPLIVPFFIGDDQGLIEVYNLHLPTRRSGTDYDIHRITKFQAHKDSITQISAITPILYASSSVDRRVVFFTYDFITSTFQTTQVLNDTEPIISFTYSQHQKCLATSGISRDAYIWSHETGKKISKLGGHYNQVAKILSYTTTTKENYILTLTTKKEFRLWDNVNYRLMKEWTDPQFYRPENRYGAIFYDPVRCQIITAATGPIKWAEDAAAMSTSLDHKTHSHSIVAIFNAPEFDQLVTVDSVCCIKAWNTLTGAPESSHMEPLTDDSSDIAAATLDFNKRTLITTTFKNKIQAWNYNSGSLINEIKLNAVKSPNSVIRCFSEQGRDYLVLGGWEKTVWLYIKVNVSEYELHKTFIGHTTDISEIQPFANGIVSGAVNGELLSWAFDTTVPISACQLQPETGVETMKIIDSTLFVGDSNGLLHLLKIPKFEIIYSFLAHNSTAKHSITAMEVDMENKLFYTADTLGYVKQWQLFFNEEQQHYDIKPFEPNKLFRCHRDEIVSLALIQKGCFIATCGADMCVRLFRTEDFAYVGYFSDEQRWDLANQSTWVNEAPFIVDETHFKKGKGLFAQSVYGAIKVFNQPNLIRDKLKKATSYISKNRSKLINMRQLDSQNTISRKDLGLPDDNDEDEQLKRQAAFGFKNEAYMYVDFDKITKTIEEYMTNPPNYQPQSIITGNEKENLHPPPLKPIPPLQINSRPNELLSTIKHLLPHENSNSKSRPEEVKRKVKLPISIRPVTAIRRQRTTRRPKSYAFDTSNLSSTL